MKSLSTLLNKMISEGYKVDFKVTDRGLESLQNGKVYKPEQVRIVNFFRFEGMSDPEDNAILYVIETDDGAKGTLVDAYGPYADRVIEKFIKEVEIIEKKAVKN